MRKFLARNFGPLSLWLGIFIIAFAFWGMPGFGFALIGMGLIHILF